MYKNKKIGVGVITCNRPKFLQDCLNGLSLCKNDIDEMIIVNDGKECNYNVDIQHKLIQHKHNMGISKTKNEAFLYLLNKDCEYIFIIEDDCTIINKDCLKKYCETSNISGLQHLLYAFKQPPQRLMRTIKYKNCNVELYLHTIAAFCFFTRKCLINCGLMDEFYHNSTEHIDHSYRLILNKYTFGWGMFPDIENSDKYINISNHFKYSSCRKPKDEIYDNNIKIDNNYFKNKFGEEISKIIVNCDNNYILSQLKDISDKYSIEKANK